MKNILLLGGNGYIGSRLKQVLDQRHCTTSVDIGWFSRPDDSLISDYRNLNAGDLKKFDVIILLAGHSSVKTCDGPIQSAWLNNVTNFTDLVAKLENQLLIYASSASVYGNSLPGQQHTENIQKFMPVNNYDVTKYVLDLHAETYLQQGRPIIGLRFGTVNGWAPVLRTDVMINAMYESAYRHGVVQISNGHISRAILGIEDLCESILSCIQQPVPGIYNLSSFNLTVDSIAQVLREQLDVRLIDNGIVGNAYDFSLDTTLFQNTFNYKFRESPETILNGLIKRFQESRTQKRDQYIYYSGDESHDL